MRSQPLVILNPESAAGRTGRRRAEVVARIGSALGPVETIVTQAEGDAQAIARRACCEGRDRIVIAGGDGTISEVANGILRARAQNVQARAPTLGLLPLGSGGDFGRSLGLPRDLDGALAVIAAGATRAVDAGRIEWLRPGSNGEAKDESEEARYFVNEASAGLSGATVRWVGRSAKRMGARLGFLAGALAAIATHRATPMGIVADGELVCNEPVSLVVVANGCYFGAGMRVAPNADPEDGAFELVIVRGLSASRLLVNLPSLLRGTHGKHSKVSFMRAKSVVMMEGASRLEPSLEIDGEALGLLPLRTEVLASALRVFVRDGEPAREGIDP